MVAQKFEVIDKDSTQYYRRQYAQLMTTKYDDLLMPLDGLSWLPWVGCGYEKCRVLVVGDSHYYKIEEEKAVSNDPYHTRAVIADVRRQTTYDAALELCCHSSDSAIVSTEERMRFWSSVAFMNLSTKPVFYRNQKDCERPSVKDYVDGWGALAEVVKVLRPSFCLLLGTEGVENSGSGQKRKPYYIARDEKGLVSGTDIVGTDKIEKCYPRPFLLTVNDMAVSTLAVLHPSRMHDVDAWRSFANGFKFRNQKYTIDHRPVSVDVNRVDEFSDAIGRIVRWMDACEVVAPPN